MLSLLPHANLTSASDSNSNDKYRYEDVALRVKIKDARYIDYEGDGLSNDIIAHIELDVDTPSKFKLKSVFYIYLELPSGKYFEYTRYRSLSNGELGITLILFDHALESGDYYLIFGVSLRYYSLHAYDDIIFDPPGGDQIDPTKGIKLIYEKL